MNTMISVQDLRTYSHHNGPISVVVRTPDLSFGGEGFNSGHFSAYVVNQGFLPHGVDKLISRGQEILISEE